MKIFSIILASGSGTRFSQENTLPKQFLDLQGKPVFIRTLEQFLNTNNIHNHIVVTNPEYFSLTQELCKQFINEDSHNIYIVTGDTDRQGSILKALEYIRENFTICAEDIVMTHDAVRPILFQEIIQKNIEEFYDKSVVGVNTVIPSFDTMVYTNKEGDIEKVIPREYLYRGQTPQSFRFNSLYSLLSSMSLNDRLVLTDAVKILVEQNKRVTSVNGHLFNMKITIYDDYILLKNYFNKLGDQLINYGTYFL